MRTTLAIDDDVLAAAKHLAEREHRSIGEVISALARQGLARGTRSSHSRATDSYLLPLAKQNNGKLATMDQKLASAVVTNGPAALTLI